MTERHATTADLPGWNTPDTVLGLHRNPDAYGWVALVSYTTGTQDILGRDMQGHLYVATDAAITAKTPTTQNIEAGHSALLVGVADGVGVWIPRTAYHHVKVIDPTESGAQPDVPRWLPIAEVLPEVHGHVPPPTPA